MKFEVPSIISGVPGNALPNLSQLNPLAMFVTQVGSDKFNTVMCLVQSRQSYGFFILSLVHTGLRWCLFVLLNAE